MAGGLHPVFSQSVSVYLAAPSYELVVYAFDLSTGLYLPGCLAPSQHKSFCFEHGHLDAGYTPEQALHFWVASL